jgi:hypothetical protein
MVNLANYGYSCFLKAVKGKKLLSDPLAACKKLVNSVIDWVKLNFAVLAIGDNFTTKANTRSYCRSTIYD